MEFLLRNRASSQTGAHGDVTITVEDAVDVIRVIRRKERVLVARVLHDEISQMISASRTILSDIMMTSHPSRESLETAFAMIDKTLSVARRETEVLCGERPDIWELLFRARMAIRELGQRTGMATSCAIIGELREFGRVSDETAVVVGWIVDESIRNCESHSSAASAQLRIEVGDGELSFELRDDGRGIPHDHADHKGMGLGIMRENVERLNGIFSISPAEASHGTGTTVYARLPVIG